MNARQAPKANIEFGRSVVIQVREPNVPNALVLLVERWVGKQLLPVLVEQKTLRRQGPSHGIVPLAFLTADRAYKGAKRALGKIQRGAAKYLSLGTDSHQSAMGFTYDDLPRANLRRGRLNHQ